MKLVLEPPFFGADDMDGNRVGRPPQAVRGPRTATGGKAELVGVIRDAGRVPVERDALTGVR